VLHHINLQVPCPEPLPKSEKCHLISQLDTRCRFTQAAFTSSGAKSPTRIPNALRAHGLWYHFVTICTGILGCKHVYTHKKSVIMHVERMPKVPRSLGAGFQYAVEFAGRVPKGSHMFADW
jgi:hypothetical protein